jgi:hypothetical protein
MSQKMSQFPGAAASFFRRYSGWGHHSSSSSSAQPQPATQVQALQAQTEPIATTTPAKKETDVKIVRKNSALDKARYQMGGFRNFCL